MIAILLCLALQDTGKANIQPRPLPQEPIRVFPVRVSSRIQGEERPTYEKLAAHLTGMEAMPDDRILFYAAVFEQYSVQGWRGILDRVEPIQGGYLVTVRVLP